MVRLARLTAGDLPAVLAIRNDPSTRNMLHDRRSFEQAEAEAWFRDAAPIWFRIHDEGGRMVGYVRTSRADHATGSVFVGCDIDPISRRRGYAREAYRVLLPELWKRGWREARLLVRRENEPAIALYRQLGFSEVGGDAESYEMAIRSPRQFSGRNVKVIATYFGDRRAYPTNATDARLMLGYLWKQELSVSQGAHLDTVFVNNRVFRPGGRMPADAVSSYEAVDQCEALLRSFHRLPTRNGQAMVLERENIGISFGAFDFAFRTLTELYDYWFFVEDDQVIVTENAFQRCVAELMNYQDIGGQPCGFVATVGVNRQIGPSVHGGCGVTSRWVLKHVFEETYSEIFRGGHLPFWHTDQRGANGHELAAEVPFTQRIHDLGYRLEEYPGDVCVSWGSHTRRTGRTIPFSDSMRAEADQFLQNLAVARPPPAPGTG